jgi:hypothetical protein
MEFEQALRRLIATYEAGELVPFLGAGMSVPSCTDWPLFIRGLERRAEIAAGKVDTDPAALIRRANRAVRTLKLRDSHGFPAAVGKALTGSGDGPPPQTDALAKTWWPLVLTTNYDMHFHHAFGSAHRNSRLLVRGRRPQHCQDVLSSLTAPSDPILWALQGFLASSGEPQAEAPPELADELVIGHEEYRRVTYREQHFRKAFAEVYRRRSLLFLGSGLKDSYLLELFGEILEFYGANPLYHYAFAKQGEVDADFLLARFNTIVVEYADHGELPGLLDRFNAAVADRRPRTMRWAYALECGTKLGDSDVTDLSIVRGRLPLPEPRTGECVAISAGGGGSSMFLSGEMERYVIRAGAQGRVGDVRAHRVKGSNVWRYGRSPLFAIVARGSGDVRDVRAISRAVREFCTVASRHYSLARMQLLGAGRGRTFPARFSLIESVRGFVEWRRENPGSDFRLAVHVVAPDVLFDLTTRRVDILELLTCLDIRFWVEIVLATGDVERHLQHCPADTPVDSVARRFDIPPLWQLEIIPAPQLGEPPAILKDLPPGQTIETIGIVPGCTVRFAEQPNS